VTGAAVRLDVAPEWDLALLKSGDPVALHQAAAAAAWGVQVMNGPDQTRLAQDRIAVAFILRRAGLPVPLVRAIHVPQQATALESFRGWDRRARFVKSRRGSRGTGLWRVGPDHAPDGPGLTPSGAYLIMDEVPHEGDDLKVYVVDDWLAAIERRFPATTLTEKRGRRVAVPEEAGQVAISAGRLLGLRLYGCDFVRGRTGWVLVDVNAFPGYKGIDDAAEHIAQALDEVPPVAGVAGDASRPAAAAGAA